MVKIRAANILVLDDSKPKKALELDFKLIKRVIFRGDYEGVSDSCETNLHS